MMQYYSVKYPKEDEFVLVQFIEETDQCFKAKLLEYHEILGMMNHKDVSKKRWVNYNKLAPLNKNIIAKVEQVDTKNNIVQLSIYFRETKQYDNEALSQHFNENKMLEGFIKTMSINETIEYNLIWTNLIHYVDTIRRDSNKDNEENFSLGKFFFDNFQENIEEWIDDIEMPHIKDSIISLYDKRFSKPNQKITSKIGIISFDGVQYTKELLAKVLKSINHDYTFKYLSAPYYLFESDEVNSDEHRKFIINLEKESKLMNSAKIFIKVESTIIS